MAALPVPTTSSAPRPTTLNDALRPEISVRIGSPLSNFEKPPLNLASLQPVLLSPPKRDVGPQPAKIIRYDPRLPATQSVLEVILLLLGDYPRALAGHQRHNTGQEIKESKDTNLNLLQSRRKSIYNRAGVAIVLLNPPAAPSELLSGQ